jgi:hypothetical protein
VATVHVPYTVEQDEDGVWCAHAWLGSSGGANGNGATPEEAVADLREAVQMVIDEDGIPEQLAHTLDLEVARCRRSRRYAGTSSSGPWSGPGSKSRG